MTPTGIKKKPPGEKKKKNLFSIKTSRKPENEIETVKLYVHVIYIGEKNKILFFIFVGWCVFSL